MIACRIGPFPEIVGRCGGGELFGDGQELKAAMRRYLALVQRVAEEKGRVEIAQTLSGAARRLAGAPS